MLGKLFINVFFEKKKFLVLFMLVLFSVVVFLSFQIMMISNQYEQVAMPDIEVTGRIDDDGVFRYKMYNDISGFSDEVKSLTEGKAKVYGTICRNILTQNDLFNKISYVILGVDEQFLSEELSQYIKEGRLPQKGKKEAVIGSLAARYYKVKVGDRLNIHVSLKKQIEDEDKSSCIVSGILSDNVDYFKGAIFISKETYSSDITSQEENLSFLYVKDGNEYDEVFKACDSMTKKQKIGTIRSNFTQKSSLMKAIVTNTAMILAICLLIVFLILSLLMKGIKKKIGLLKALGISDQKIIHSFAGGLGISSGAAVMAGMAGSFLLKNLLNSSISNYLGYKVEQYKLNAYVFLCILALETVILATVFVSIYLLSRRVSPRDAMLKN